MNQSFVVAARYTLATAPVTPKQALAIAKQYAGRITRGAAAPAELRRAYLEMAKRIRPLGSLLQDVTIQRSDEARKLKSVQQWLRVVLLRTDPEKIEEIPDDELDVALPMRLESLIDTLKSLARVESRLTDYTSVEKVIPHGAYKILNQHGFRPDEYQGVIQLLDAASEVIARAGFGQAVYGEVSLESKPGQRWAGLYSHRSDDISLNMGVNHRDGSAVYSLVHELGHRVWFKFLSETQREHYEDQYFGTAPLRFSLQDREQFWHAWEESGWDARAARKRLPVPLQEPFAAYLADYKKHGVSPNTKGLQISPEMLRRQFVRSDARYIVLDHKDLSSVTDYGQTSVLEDFAEVFAHHCLGYRLTLDARDRFHQATGKS